MATQPQQIEVPEVHHVALKPPPELTALSMAREPEIVLAEAARAAQALRQVIEQKPKKVVLNGKTFLQFEDWQTLGRFYGITAVGRETKYVTFGKVQGFESQADALLVSNDQVISHAEAMCLDDEANWGMRPVYEWNNNRRTKVGEEPVPLYQLRSMAQTRACAKALRNVLAWVVVLAGYQPTPAEEMSEANDDTHTEPSVSAPPSGSGLPKGRMEQMLTKMREAASMGQLQTVYTAAYKEAQAVNDRRAMSAYITTTNIRKRELK